MLFSQIARRVHLRQIATFQKTSLSQWNRLYEQFLLLLSKHCFVCVLFVCMAEFRLRPHFILTGSKAVGGVACSDSPRSSLVVAGKDQLVIHNQVGWSPFSIVSYY